MTEIDPALLVIVTAVVNGAAMMAVNHTNIQWLKDSVRDLREEVRQLRGSQ